MKEIIDFINKGKKFLNTAQHSLEIEDYDTCVSRSYYAMFFLVEAVLLTKRLSASSHKGVISLFGEYFIKPGIFEKDMGKALNYAYDERLVGDYGVGFLISKDEAKDILETARYFVNKLENYLMNWMKENNNF